MKNLLFLTMMLITGIVSTQSKYEAGMGKAFEQMKAVKTAEDMGATAAFFERIADTEKDKWLPYYYAAYCNYLTGWMNPNADKDAVGEKAKALPLEKIEIDEKKFRWMLCENAMATEKLYEGIRNFAKDSIKLEKAIEARL